MTVSFLTPPGLGYFEGMGSRGAVLALCLAALPAFSQRFDVKTHTLANGMKILVQEDHDIPNVAMYFFYRIGSRNERPGTTGISHFFEHMMFNGAKKYGPKQFDIRMEMAGGHNNAYTSQDVTVYTDWFPRSALDLMFDMEADRIRDLAFDPKIIESERGVVYSERRTSVDNSNFGVLHEQLNAAAYTAHPYGWPVVGWASDIESWTLEDLKNHFAMGYAPNNCTMVVTGDVNFDEVLALAKKYLEPIPRHEPPPPVRTKEPEQRGERRVEVRKPAQLPIQMVAYHAASGQDPDFLPLQVLETILTRGRSSRLHRRMVEQDQVAISVEVHGGASMDPGLMVFAMQPRAGVATATTEKVLYEELDKLRSAPVSNEELEKARNQLLTEVYEETKTIAGRANALGTYEVFRGGYQKLFNAENDLDKVTAADVQRVARKYLSPEKRTVATLIADEQAPKTEQEATQE